MSEKEKMLELLSDQAVFGLTEKELEELAELEKHYPELSAEAESLELSAAAVGLMNLDASEPLPAHLQARVLASAEEFFAAREKTAATAVEPARSDAPAEKEDLQPTFGFEPKRAGSLMQWLGWAVAGAACIALAISLWVPRGTPQFAGGPTPTPTATPRALTPAEEREALLASAKDVMRSDWSDYPDPKRPKFNVEGDVVWSNAQQKGFIRFRNLPVNDRTKEQYQLWIFDKAQKNPIAGGVFDVDRNGEVVIPIDAAINVQEPTMFGVTAEKPGGVMVSGLEKVLAVAKVSA